MVVCARQRSAMHQYSTPACRHGECGTDGWPDEPKTAPVKFGLSINHARAGRQGFSSRFCMPPCKITIMAVRRERKPATSSHPDYSDTRGQSPHFASFQRLVEKIPLSIDWLLCTACVKRVRACLVHRYRVRKERSRTSNDGKVGWRRWLNPMEQFRLRQLLAADCGTQQI